MQTTSRPSSAKINVELVLPRRLIDEGTATAWVNQQLKTTDWELVNLREMPTRDIHCIFSVRARLSVPVSLTALSEVLS